MGTGKKKKKGKGKRKERSNNVSGYFKYLPGREKTEEKNSRKTPSGLKEKQVNSSALAKDIFMLSSEAVSICHAFELLAEKLIEPIAESSAKEEKLSRIAKSLLVMVKNTEEFSTNYFDFLAEYKGILQSDNKNRKTENNLNEPSDSCVDTKAKKIEKFITKILGICTKNCMKQVIFNFSDYLIFNYYDGQTCTDIANCILKMTPCVGKCLAEQSNFLKVLSALSPWIFIKYFLLFCNERRVKPRRSSLDTYYCGISRSARRYMDYFEETLGDHEADVLKLILADKNLSPRDAYNLLSWYEKAGIEINEPEC